MLPPFIHKLFCYRKISETLHQMLALGNIGHCEENFSTENLDTPPFIHKRFCYRKVSETLHKMVALRSNRHHETKVFRRKILMLPPFIHKLFRYRRNSETLHQMLALRNIGHCEEKFSTENLDTPLSSINLFATGKYPKHCTKGLPYEIFATMRQKLFGGKILMLPLSFILKIFRYLKLVKQ